MDQKQVFRQPPAIVSLPCVATMLPEQVNTLAGIHSRNTLPRVVFWLKIHGFRVFSGFGSPPLAHKRPDFSKMRGILHLKNLYVFSMGMESGKMWSHPGLRVAAVRARIVTISCLPGHPAVVADMLNHTILTDFSIIKIPSVRIDLKMKI